MPSSASRPHVIPRMLDAVAPVVKVPISKVERGMRRRSRTRRMVRFSMAVEIVACYQH